MSQNRWLIILLVGAGLLIYGYIVRSGQSSAPKAAAAPISVAAVRGGAEEVPATAPDANVASGYVAALQDDVEMAKKRTDAYNAAVKARSAAFSRAGQSDGAAPQ